MALNINSNPRSAWGSVKLGTSAIVELAVDIVDVAKTGNKAIKYSMEETANKYLGDKERGKVEEISTFDGHKIETLRSYAAELDTPKEPAKKGSFAERTQQIEQEVLMASYERIASLTIHDKFV